MKRLLIALAAFLAVSPAFAQQKTTAEIKSDITTLFPSNATGAITAERLRQVANEIADSYANKGERISVADFGAKCDGSTDDAAAFTSAIAAAGGRTVNVPGAACRLASGITVTAGVTLRGEAFFPANPPTGSRLVCDSGVATCVTVSSGLNSGVLRDISVVGATGTPASGSIGVLWQGYQSWAQNVYVGNFGTCSKWLAAGTSGISFTGQFYNQAQCQAHYFVFDGWPEARFFGGRSGANGSGDYSAASDFVYFTRTGALGSGGGPNTILFDGHHFNPAGGGVQCAIRWGGMTGSGGLQIETRFTDVHVEYHTYTGGGTQGIFCSDNTVPLIPQLFVRGMVTAVGSAGTVPLFSLDPLTALKQVYISDNVFGCSNITLAPLPASGAAFSDVNFSHNFGCGSASFTASGSNNSMFTTGNNWGSNLTLAGAWQRLEMLNDAYSGTLTDTATGKIGMSNSFTWNWTPVLKFGGATTGITYAGQSGFIQRTATGGFIASYSITLTSKGTATGAAQITGIPYACGSGFNPGLANTATGFSGLTGSVGILMNGGAGTNLNVVQSAASGQSNLSDTDFTNTTSLKGTVTCNSAS